MSGIRDQVFLKILPIRVVIHFSNKHGKLSSRFINLLEIVERVGDVAYKLILLSSLVGVHAMFYMSQLRQSIPNMSHV